MPTVKFQLQRIVARISGTEDTKKVGTEDVLRSSLFFLLCLVIEDLINDQFRGLLGDFRRIFLDEWFHGSGKDVQFSWKYLFSFFHDWEIVAFVKKLAFEVLAKKKRVC